MSGLLVFFTHLVQTSTLPFTNLLDTTIKSFVLSCLSIKQQEILYHFCSAFVSVTLLLAVLFHQESFFGCFERYLCKSFHISKMLKQ